MYKINSSLQPYKEITKASYEATAKEFAKNVAHLAPKHSIERLASLLPPGGTLIDIGWVQAEMQEFSQKRD
ncbi:hypothetical protein ACQUW5_13435 [Legionella sp. CNM-1927-20]|uniref:hypothetical protein n=1 Tax=Legionella sp. CNM-1927-20 TaxID=3422221 RepID=UPI00403B0414